jgi:23S rRNA (guanine745-N1)-methyltransferase
MERLPLSCPVCHHPLVEAPAYFSCELHHHFDKSRHGYVNLLLAHKRRSKEPGDSKEMLRSRAAFLNKGHYTLISQLLNVTVKEKMRLLTHPPINIADIGCGNGYYLLQLSQQENSFTYFGMDIAKEGIQLAAKESKNIRWLIDSIAQIPFQDHQLQGIISIFSPVNFAEFARILAQDGYLFIIRPSPQHLYELRDLLFSDIKNIQQDRMVEEAKSHFSIIQELPLTYEMTLNNEDLNHLLKMTPYYWRCTPAKRNQVLAMPGLKLTVDITLRVLGIKSLHDAH